jgi:hypothetical protein
VTTVFTPPFEYMPPSSRVGEPLSIFLAGAIDMGSAVNWQADVAQQLANDNYIVFNPRREHFDETTLDEQIAWELRHLEMADIVFLWLPKDAKAPISLFEAGLYWRSGKLLIGAEEGFYRRRNLELTSERYSLPIYATLDAMIEALQDFF